MNKNTQVPVEAVAAVAVTPVHPLHKSHRLISSKDVDFNKLTAIESVAMSFALALSVLGGLSMVLNHGISVIS
jgi:hypothetical protein